MSEGHANLFAFAVPANESSSTIGLNGDQPARNEHSEQSHGTNSSRETRNERNTSITAGEDADGQPEQQLPRDNDEDPDEEYSLEEESINLMDEIVENFRCKEITNSVRRSSSLDWKKDRNRTEPNHKRPDHRLQLHKF